MKAVVLGGGSWGTAFSRVLAMRSHSVTLACRDPKQVKSIRRNGRNPRYLQNADISDIAATTIEDAPLAEAELVVMAVPSHAFGEVAELIPPSIPVLSLTKGLDPATGARLSTLVNSRPVAVLSGPNFAEEIVHGLPSAAVIASEDDDFAVHLQHEINSLVFRVYVNSDPLGVELCAAAKNVIALAAGAVDGLGLGDNAKAAVITRGLAEMSKLGAAYGAKPETFAGLAGMGDLIVTCWSSHGRNRLCGELMARGATTEEALAHIGMAVEGVTTAPVLSELSHRQGIELPITDAVSKMLSGDDPTYLVLSLMGRPPTEE